MAYVVLVTGSRNLMERAIVLPELERLHKEHNDLVVVHGGAKGADRAAASVCAQLQVYQVPVAPLWGRYGNAAGILSNQLMLDLFKVDEAIAFPLEGSVGTFDMMRRLRAAGIPVRNVTGYEKGESK